MNKDKSGRETTGKTVLKRKHQNQGNSDQETFETGLSEKDESVKGKI